MHEVTTLSSISEAQKLKLEPCKKKIKVDTESKDDHSTAADEATGVSKDKPQAPKDKVINLVL